MSSSGDTNWVTGPTGPPIPPTQSEKRRARKARNRQHEKDRRKERQRQQQQQQQHRAGVRQQLDGNKETTVVVEKQQQQQQKQQQPQKQVEGVAPPLRKEEVPLTTTVLVPTPAEAHTPTAPTLADATVDIGSSLKTAVGAEAAAAAAAADSVVTMAKGPTTVGMEHADRSEDSLSREMSPADSMPLEDKMRKHDMNISDDEQEGIARAAEVRARRAEAAKKMESKGPSAFESATTTPCPNPVVQSAPQPACANIINLSILDRTTEFAMACGLWAGVVPQLLYIMVSTVFGEEFATTVSVMSAEQVEYMLQVFWMHEMAPFSVDEVFCWLASPYRNGAITRESLRPFILGAVQPHYEYQILAPHVRAQYIEAVLSTTFSKLSRGGVITLNDLRGSDFVASLNAVGRLEMRLQDSIYFSPSIMLAMMHVGYQFQPYYQSGGCNTGYGGSFQPYNSQSGVPIINAPHYVHSPW